MKVGHQQDLNAGTWTRSSGIASGNTNDATRRTIRFDLTDRTDRTGSRRSGRACGTRSDAAASSDLFDG